MKNFIQKKNIKNQYIQIIQEVILLNVTILLNVIFVKVNLKMRIN